LPFLSAAEIEVEEWPTPKYRSQSLSLFWETRNTAELTIGMKFFSSLVIYVHRLDGPHPKSINHSGCQNIMQGNCQFNNTGLRQDALLYGHNIDKIA
jgi:hypothetical protein